VNVSADLGIQGSLTPDLGAGFAFAQTIRLIDACDGNSPGARSAVARSRRSVTDFVKFLADHRAVAESNLVATCKTVAA